MDHENIVMVQSETPLKHRGKEEAEEQKKFQGTRKHGILRVYVTGATL
jgi:hypothetical protein